MYRELFFISFTKQLYDTRTSAVVVFSCTVQYNAAQGSIVRYLDGLKHGVDDVRTGLENVRPHEVQQVHQSVLAPQHGHSQRQVLHRRARRLRIVIARIEGGGGVGGNCYWSLFYGSKKKKRS